MNLKSVVFNRSTAGDLPHPDQPICAEIFSVERLEQFAATLAASHDTLRTPLLRAPLHRRMTQNAALLRESMATLAATRDEASVTPASEWFVDNFHIVDAQIRSVRRDLPPGYYRQLPKLANGELRGLPRVFDLAWHEVAHTDSRFEREVLLRFCRAYQRVKPLQIGELWAISISLRIVLIENLRRLCACLIARGEWIRKADAIVDALPQHESLAAVPALRSLGNAALPPALAAQLFQRLRDQGAADLPSLNWLHARLAAQHANAEEVVHQEHQRQSAINVSVRNVITSLKLIGDMDWPKFVESISVVDAMLAGRSEFARMDFMTRDQYRHVIEALSRRSRFSETEVTQILLDEAASRHCDPGYLLLGGGRVAMERAVRAKLPPGEIIGRVLGKAGLPGYVLGIAGFTALLLLVPLTAQANSPLTATLHWLLGCLALLPAADAAVAIVNYWVTHRCGTRPLPAMELADGVPPNLSTMVVMPILLTRAAAIDEAVERLEVHYLSNPDDHVHFALLSDWTDAEHESRADDDALLQLAIQGIDGLNRRHPGIEGQPRFRLLHRRRLWNAAEKCWMGWERKRGKLHELNQLLLGTGQTTFVALNGATLKPPTGIRYVITLDADTRLPRGSVRTLIGKMAHPLNQAQLDPDARRVVKGHGVLQPRVTCALPLGRDRTAYQAAFSGPCGVDPYAHAVSDVYQDLFDEGSYAGKGIYDVQAFEAALAARVPDNTLLSHDLLEGVYTRSGFASDVEVIEDFPARYDVASAREHRWIRGDWQLLPWIAGRRGADLPALARWKMLDNLRRSLTPGAAVMTLLVAWAAGTSWSWTAFILATLAVSSALPLVDAAAAVGEDDARDYLARLGEQLRQAAGNLLLRICLLLDRALNALDAVLRTLWRLCVTRRHLLQWTSAAESAVRGSTRLLAYWRAMAAGPLLCMAAAPLMLLQEPVVAVLSLPFLALWALAPAVAWRCSRPHRQIEPQPLDSGERQSLRSMARQTWSFFDTFVTAQHHHLPPDNYQEVPHGVVAGRTSPTNIGLYLLAVVAARDFAWLGRHATLSRLEATLGTVRRLGKFRGHLYNWYDTQDLRELDPKYISSVDSGNLAGHLLTLAGACEKWLQEEAAGPALHTDFAAGILDTLSQTRHFARSLEQETRRYHTQPARLVQALDSLEALLTAGGDPAALLAHAATEAMHILDMSQAITDERGEGEHAPLLRWASALQRNVLDHQADATAGAEDGRQRARLTAIGREAHALARDMDFSFLVDPVRQLLSIGYRVEARELDASCYDLLASEARLGSFVAIAKGDLPVKHWFLLGRPMTVAGDGAALISWSGSMFEYLMPVLVMAEPPDSLLERTERAVVRRQIEFGRQRGLPWGVSESGFNARDLEFTYQYSTFGVPGLGLKRGLNEDAVVAPYATALAAMIEPRAALENLQALSRLGARGRYGWYEAIDFTPLRVPEGKKWVLVRSYMAHHQAMVLLSFADVLQRGRMRRRFHSLPMIKATELLLQERFPREVSRRQMFTDPQAKPQGGRPLTNVVARRFDTANLLHPRTHLLSNGNYSVMLTSAGSGYSRWRDIAVTRWREDPVCDEFGSYIYLRDVGSGEVWSAGFQPLGREPDSYAVEFHEDRAIIERRDGHLHTSQEIIVSPEDDAEMRRIVISNHGDTGIDIEITTYQELALAPPGADAAHPAFSKMFVQTEYVAEGGVLLARRRPRDPAEVSLWAAHLCIADRPAIGTQQFESDRAQFIGRGRSLRRPVSVMDARPLSNSAGTVLDPVLSLRRRVRIPPGESATFTLWTLVAETREAALQLADKHRDAGAHERVRTMAWTQAQMQLRFLDIDFEEAQLFQRLANRVLYADDSLRAPPEVLAANQDGPRLLWAHGVSGDLPIVLARIAEDSELPVIRQLIRAHEYWRAKRLDVDLVILNERAASYISELQQVLEADARAAQARTGQSGAGAGSRGRIFVLRSDLVPAAHQQLLQVAARVVIIARRGDLKSQVSRASELPTPKPPLTPPEAEIPQRVNRPIPDLDFFNGLGGFTKNGEEYLTILDERETTPAPWVNVIANPHFGFLVSAMGAGNTYSQNSREYQLTPWSNDPVSEPPGEVFYVKDLDGGQLWSLTALPIREDTSPYLCWHGQGYTRFEHRTHEIAGELLQFVPPDDAVKISRIKLINQSARPRHLSVTGYLEWVLGDQRQKSAFFLVTGSDSELGALTARNPWNMAFEKRVAFFDMLGRQQSFTTDRTEFLGRHGAKSAPLALRASTALSGRTGAGFDACGALQSTVRLQPGESVEFVFLLGDAASEAQARELVQRYRAADLDAVFGSVREFWRRTLGTVQVRTPDRAMDLLLNRWLMYQTLACRVWARAGFYQASGAFGFRDQLQDVMTLCLNSPRLTRDHIVLAASRQFEEGDVQHWWLPSSGFGVRTRIVDNRVWLPFVTTHYMRVTGDRGVLEENIGFLGGAPLRPDQHEEVTIPPPSGQSASLFEHCARALDVSLGIGEHGLPLFGTGDWNDGMNRVGMEGRGESVWMAWFLYATLMAFAPVAEARGETARAQRWRDHAFRLQQAVEREAWDGDWYRRGYFDDGSPLGSISSDECRIDSIAQSWGVISGAADRERSLRAMAAVDGQLVSRADALIRLFTPAFDRSSHDPGYVKGYPAGLRENGGQYTHGAIWSVLAFARLGDGDRAGELFSLINPIHHASSRAGIYRYKVEPYVACADIYTAPGHVGRGGWTWYTGSAGWMYRAALEGLLGLNVEADTMRLAPCIPRAWRGFEIDYVHRGTLHSIRVDNPHGVSHGLRKVLVDGVARNVEADGAVLPLFEDGATHRIEITLG